MMPGDGKISDGMLKLLARLVRSHNLSQQEAWMMMEETIKERLLESDGPSTFSK